MNVLTNIQERGKGTSVLPKKKVTAGMDYIPDELYN